MKNLSMDKEIITFEMIGAAYVALADAERAEAKIIRRFQADRATIEQCYAARDAVTAARQEKNRLVLTFAGAVRANSVTVYSDAA